jgi:type IV secretion system protein VirB9
MKRVVSLLLLGLLSVATAAAAQGDMAPIADADSRLREIDYQEGEVYRLSGCLGFQTTITLAADERVENIGIGDSSLWQVMPNKRGNLIFVKPTAAKAFSNMTIITDKRSYNFELRSAADADCQKGRVTYELRFHYAPPPPANVAPGTKPADPNAFLPVPEKRNTAYTFTGSADLVPLRVFDDGTSTYFRWSPNVSTPAVYALNSDNSESLINYASRGDYLVVEQVSGAFVLRRGDQKTILYNDAYRPQGLDAQSPKPRKSGGK